MSRLVTLYHAGLDRTVDVPPKTAEHLLARSGWSRLDDGDTPEPTDDDVELECDVCGFVAATGAGLSAHRRTHV